MFSKIHPFYFIFAFAIGLLYCYLTHPKPTVVVKFPSPYNAGTVVYKGEDDACFKIAADKVECPVDKSLIKPQPIK